MHKAHSYPETIKTKESELSLESTEKPAKRVCPSCGKDLSSMPADIRSCPYCNAILIRQCPYCERELASFPLDIKRCPYCGSSLRKEFKLLKHILGVAFLAYGFVWMLLIKGAPLSEIFLFFMPISPYGFIFIPYFALSFYLILDTKPRKKIDVIAIFVCALISIILLAG
jgi:Zn finger protein HypA/HybF involved in hydrogenase expression